eukprot:TRINITY_DN1759_c0_g1_i1.p1 TRINITY_DN1759_c0_g1~~TRINITY_DN1759_c0_g1_i1.p1  ORF type:complete len:1068 (+),score=213.49 TRINITY_DN1759_c0_g1_i1:226-3429(+)
MFDRKKKEDITRTPTYQNVERYKNQEFGIMTSNAFHIHVLIALFEIIMLFFFKMTNFLYSFVVIILCFDILLIFQRLNPTKDVFYISRKMFCKLYIIIFLTNCTFCGYFKSVVPLQLCFSVGFNLQIILYVSAKSIKISHQTYIFSICFYCFGVIVHLLTHKLKINNSNIFDELTHFCTFFSFSTLLKNWYLLKLMKIEWKIKIKKLIKFNRKTVSKILINLLPFELIKHFIPEFNEKLHNKSLVLKYKLAFPQIIFSNTLNIIIKFQNNDKIVNSNINFENVAIVTDEIHKNFHNFGVRMLEVREDSILVTFPISIDNIDIKLIVDIVVKLFNTFRPNLSLCSISNYTFVILNTPISLIFFENINTYCILNEQVEKMLNIRFQNSVYGLIVPKEFSDELIKRLSDRLLISYRLIESDLLNSTTNTCFEYFDHYELTVCHSNDEKYIPMFQPISTGDIISLTEHSFTAEELHLLRRESLRRGSIFMRKVTNINYGSGTDTHDDSKDFFTDNNGIYGANDFDKNDSKPETSRFEVEDFIFHPPEEILIKSQTIISNMNLIEFFLYNLFPRFLVIVLCFNYLIYTLNVPECESFFLNICLDFHSLFTDVILILLILCIFSEIICLFVLYFSIKQSFLFIYSIISAVHIFILFFFDVQSIINIKHHEKDMFCLFCYINICLIIISSTSIEQQKFQNCLNKDTSEFRVFGKFSLVQFNYLMALFLLLSLSIKLREFTILSWTFMLLSANLSDRADNIKFKQDLNNINDNLNEFVEEYHIYKRNIPNVSIDALVQQDVHSSLHSWVAIFDFEKVLLNSDAADENFKTFFEKFNELFTDVDLNYFSYWRGSKYMIFLPLNKKSIKPIIVRRSSVVHLMACGELIHKLFPRIQISFIMITLFTKFLEIFPDCSAAITWGSASLGFTSCSWCIPLLMGDSVDALNSCINNVNEPGAYIGRPLIRMMNKSWSLIGESLTTSPLAQLCRSPSDAVQKLLESVVPKSKSMLFKNNIFKSVCFQNIENNELFLKLIPHVPQRKASLGRSKNNVFENQKSMKFSDVIKSPVVKTKRERTI